MTSQDSLDIATLRAVLDRIIPPDQHPGALDLGTDGYVITQLAANPVLRAAVAQGLAELELRSASGFAESDESQQDELLSLHETTPWFVALVELTAEGFYADPANGGNREARSWVMIGYEHRLPDGPNGPMPEHDDAT